MYQLSQPALQGECLATLSRITRFTETQSKPASWCSHSQSLQLTVLCNDGTMPRLQPPPTHTCRRSWPPTQLVSQYTHSPHTTPKLCICGARSSGAAAAQPPPRRTPFCSGPQPGVPREAQNSRRAHAPPATQPRSAAGKRTRLSRLITSSPQCLQRYRHGPPRAPKRRPATHARARGPI